MLRYLLADRDHVIGLLVCFLVYFGSILLHRREGTWDDDAEYGGEKLVHRVEMVLQLVARTAGFEVQEVDT